MNYCLESKGLGKSFNRGMKSIQMVVLGIFSIWNEIARDEAEKGRAGQGQVFMLG